VDDKDLLPVLLGQEERLIFPAFDHDTAWRLVTAIRERAVADALPVAIEIRRNGQRLFHTALPGSSADNDAWLARKAAVVDRYGHSSYFIGCQYRSRGGSFDRDSRLDVNLYAAHGGAFPLIVAGAGVIGTVAVSGLPQVDDHRVVVEELERFLTAA